MKKTLILFALLCASSIAKSQQALVKSFPLYPIYDIKEGYDDNMTLVYNVKLVNKAKSAITGIVFELQPTWLNGDTQLMMNLRAEKTITIKRSITVASGATVIHKLETPNNKYAVQAKLVRYADGSFKTY